MPYDRDSDVPKHVPAGDRAEWRARFNGEWDRCRRDGKNDDECEKSAFAVANAIVNKSLTPAEQSIVERAKSTIPTLVGSADPEADAQIVHAMQTVAAIIGEDDAIPPVVSVPPALETEQAVVPQDTTTSLGALMQEMASLRERVDSLAQANAAPSGDPLAAILADANGHMPQDTAVSTATPELPAVAVATAERQEASPPADAPKDKTEAKMMAVEGDDYVPFWRLNRMSQQQAGYSPVGAIKSDGEKACVTCRFFVQGDGAQGRCVVVEDYPWPILATGLSNQYQPLATPEQSEPEPMPVRIVKGRQLIQRVKGLLGLGDDEQVNKAVWSTAHVNSFPDSSFLHIKPGGEKDEEGKTKPRGLRMFPYRDADGKIDLPHLRNAIARIPQADIPADLQDRLQKRAQRLLASTNAESGKDYSGLQVLKGLDGHSYLVLWYSNSFIDRDDEVITQKALSEDIAREQAVPLWFWHVPGTDHGQVVWRGLVGRMAVAVAQLDDGPLGQKALAFYKKHANDLGVSHGFRYSTALKVGGVYHDCQTFEVSPMPKAYVANPYTLVEVKAMSLTYAKRSWLENLFGADTVGKLVATAEQASKTLEDVGVEHKATAAGDTAATAATATETPAANDQAKEAGTQAEALKALLVEALTPVADVIKAQHAEVTGMAQTLKSVTERVESLAADFETLKQSDDERMAALIAPRSTADVAAKRASAADSTVVEKSAVPAPLGPNVLDDLMSSLTGGSRT